MLEHNNRLKAKALAEYITGQKLRQYLADKVHQYVGENVSVFDGACGSGQLEQFINPSKIVAVEIQAESCNALAQNFPQAHIYNQSFFTFDKDCVCDCVVMNPPFSLKFKDLSESEKAQIQAEFDWKKSGVVDDIFVLKAMKYAKRYGFFILFVGLTYRQTEKKFRELIGNQVVELNRISNAFDDTAIDVLFLVLDKQKTDSGYFSELVDFKTGERFSQVLTLETGENWQFATKPVEKENINIDEINQSLVQSDLRHFKSMLEYHAKLATLTGVDFFKLCDDASKIIQECKQNYDPIKIT